MQVFLWKRVEWAGMRLFSINLLLSMFMILYQKGICQELLIVHAKAIF